MRNIGALGVLFFLTLGAVPAFGEQIAWLQDADQAWAESVNTGRPLLLFITRSKCKYCTQMKSETFADDEVSSQINSGFVPLVIDPKTDAALIKELKIASFPTTLIISPQSVTLDRIKGYLPPEQFLKRLSECNTPVVASQPRSSRR